MKRIIPIAAGTLLVAMSAASQAENMLPTGGTNVIVVTTTTDSMDAFDQQCSLREALANANTDTVFSPVVDECPGGSAVLTDVIVLGSGAEYNLTIGGGGDDEGDLDIVDGPLPVETVDLRIETDDVGPAIIDQNLVGQRVIEIHSATVELNNVVIRDGGLDGAGGGILNDGGLLALEQVWLIGNTANTGGGLYNGGTAIIRNSELWTNNGTFLGGGAIYNGPAATLEVHDSTLQSNEGASGAGIYNDGGSLLVRGSTFIDNVASGDGGAISAVAETDISVDGSHFELNQAQNGGAIHGAAQVDVFVEDSRFEANNAAFGGALRVADAEIRSSVFKDNSAAADGGAIRAGWVDIEDSLLQGNESFLEDGGAIFAQISIRAVDTRFVDNRAGLGGAIRTQTAELVNVELVENHASESGGGLWVFDAVEIERSRFIRNTAGTDGGGLHLDNTIGIQPSVISQSLFSGNEANGEGGGLWLEAAATIANTTISGNSAAAGGGMYLDTDAEIVAFHLTLANNVQGQDLHKYGDLTLQNSIISTPGQDDCTVSLENVTIDSQGNNIADDNSCIGLDQAGDMNSTDPLLAPLAFTGGNTQTHALLPGSPAIDMANAVACAGEQTGGVDQRDGARPVGAGCDVGAHEQGATVSLTLFGDGFESP